ncbi:MAG: class I SAM-dependent methyltransferase [Proteobacteria bacterium]|nr:class I SAM-dependent methyltransferase [Pseudomonadota bacterium]MBU1583229.1 class I SAM-dependent methyltransferase [Pseudomonadota bacterium]MBU2454450.1 class I SAM-dependent methyltransferase [Pseudomonadota bacterium]MBU2631055.1 class I SAM-dependent methyltransferase [Pseudomonadota bacterium]
MKIDFKIWNSIKGFMDEDEAKRLYRIAQTASENGPVLEIGSYCGKSAFIIGSACKEKNSILFSIDHHKGSEEQQPNEEYFDIDLYDHRFSRINTFPFFQETLKRTGLETTVVPIVAASSVAAKMWNTPVSMLFIDGGHSFEAAHADYIAWARHIKPKGFLVIHDIFKDPEKGGQAPFQVYEIALESGEYEALEMTKTLGVLKKKDMRRNK